MIELGRKGRDKVTGFEGIITARVTFITGCDQYALAPKAEDGKIPDSVYFDEGRIEIIGDGITMREVASEKRGGPNRDCPRF
jgi:hypothetical protein